MFITHSCSEQSHVSMRNLGADLQLGAGSWPSPGAPWAGQEAGGHVETPAQPCQGHVATGARTPCVRQPVLHPRPVCHGNATWGEGEADFGSYSLGFSLLLFLGWNFSPI